MRTLDAGSFEVGNYLIAPRRGRGKWAVFAEDCDLCESFDTAADAIKYVIKLEMKRENAERRGRYKRGGE